MQQAPAQNGHSGYETYVNPYGSAVNSASAVQQQQQQVSVGDWECRGKVRGNGKSMATQQQ